MKTFAIVLASVTVAGLVAAGGASHGVTWLGLPVIGLAVAAAFVLQWLAFVPAFFAQTERFFDLAGSLTYLSVTGFALVVVGRFDVRACVLAGLVGVWALRLGIFLFRRIRADGKDGRFDDIKPDAGRFLVAWTLQGLWVSLTASAALAAITTSEPAPLGVLDAVGLALWVLGFSVEVVADRQKAAFRAEHPGRFIDVGLWSVSRHPNYAGEIVLWLGVAVIAASTLRGAQLVTLVSPLFVYLLLTRISGIPMLEERADERWGEEEAYQRYKERTPVLFPRPRSR